MQQTKRPTRSPSQPQVVVVRDRLQERHTDRVRAIEQGYSPWSYYAVRLEYLPDVSSRVFSCMSLSTMVWLVEMIHEKVCSTASFSTVFHTFPT